MSLDPTTDMLPLATESESESESESDVEPRGSTSPSGEARGFFDRPAPAAYLDEWAERLAAPEVSIDHQVQSVVIFRLHAEWLALATGWLVEITDAQPYHTIPYRSNEVLLGLVNIRGQLRLCVSLHGLLGVEPPEPGTAAVQLELQESGILRTPYPRMIILRDSLDHWVFQAEEVLKVDLLPTESLRKPPSTFPPGATHTQAVFDYHGHSVGLLDAMSLFTALRSHCQ